MVTIDRVARLIAGLLLVTRLAAGNEAGPGESSPGPAETRQELLRVQGALGAVKARIAELDGVRPKTDDTVRELYELQLQSLELTQRVSDLEAKVKGLDQLEEKKRELFTALKKQQFQEEYAEYVRGLGGTAPEAPRMLSAYTALCNRWRVPGEHTKPGVLIWDEGRGGPMCVCRLVCTVADKPHPNFRWEFLVDGRKPIVHSGNWYVTPGKHTATLDGKIGWASSRTQTCFGPPPVGPGEHVRRVGSSTQGGGQSNWQISRTEWRPWKLTVEFTASEGTTTRVTHVKTKKGGLFRRAEYSLLAEHDDTR